MEALMVWQLETIFAFQRQRVSETKELTQHVLNRRID